MRILHRISRKANLNQIRNRFFVLDVETNGLEATPDKFLFCCMVGYNFGKIFYSTDEIKKELSKKKYRHKYIFAHNAEYDFTAIFGNIKQNLDKGAIFSQRFMLARRNQVNFADSYNIFPTSVKEIGDAVGLKKGEIDEKLKKGTLKKIEKKHIDYCFRDCEIIYKALMKIFSLSGSVKPTLASLSILYYRRFFQPFNISYNEILSDEFFKSYFGGRTECFKLGKTHSYKYDANSMYAYSMKNCIFPNPKYLKEIKNPTIKRLLCKIKHYEGMAECTVIHKKTDYGFLPLKKNDKLLFPCGKFSGAWNFNELRYALEKKAIEIIDVKKIIWGYRMKSPFGDFVDKIYKKRIKSTGIFNLIYKSFLVSLYGKFGQRQKFREIYMKEMDYKKIFELKARKVNFEIKTFGKDRKDCILKIEKHARNKFHTIAVFSSYVTSFSRIYILDKMLQYQKFGITYVDTDCIASETKIPNINGSIKLGDFKLEDEIITNIRGNKNYEFTLNGNGVHYQKIRGIPVNAKEIADGLFSFQRILKTREALRHNLEAGKLIKTQRQVSNKYDKRTVLKNGITEILEV